MHIEGITVGPSSHPAFQEPLELELDERVNVFIGPNASGKSSLLRILAYSGLVDRSAIFPFPAVEVRPSLDWRAIFAESEGFDDTALPGVPWVYIPATRIILPSELDWADTVRSPEEAVSDSDNIRWQDNARIFDGLWVENACKSLYDGLKVYLNDRDRNQEFFRFLKVFRISYRCARKICGEVLIGRPRNHVSNEYELLVDPPEYDPLFSEPYVHPGMGALTRYGESGKALNQYVGELSAGTQGIYLWLLYISLKIWRYYQHSHHPNEISRHWENQPAILLIDEIENHLHPTWQRRVIPALLEHFPGLQIFATTHSPFVVAGLKAGQVHLLKRDDNGVVTASTNTEDIIGWTADEILRTMMGVDDPTDLITIERSNRLRELRQKQSLTEDEESELNTLRRQVNESLLSRDGPVEPQRERYSDLMQRFLQTRQSDLTQDGG